MAKLTIRKINELLKDEKMAHKEYEEIFKSNPKRYAIFRKMAEDEYNHYKKLIRLKAKIKKNKK